MDYYDRFKSEKWRTNTFNFKVGDSVKRPTERKFQCPRSSLQLGFTAKIVAIKMGSIGVMGALLDGYGDVWHSLSNLDLVEGNADEQAN